jgi:hypothetical protein
MWKGKSTLYFIPSLAVVLRLPATYTHAQDHSSSGIPHSWLRRCGKRRLRIGGADRPPTSRPDGPKPHRADSLHHRTVTTNSDP